MHGSMRVIQDWLIQIDGFTVDSVKAPTVNQLELVPLSPRCFVQLFKFPSLNTSVNPERLDST